jgi:hypothetical protein
LPPKGTESSVKPAALLPSIQEFPGSNLGQEMGYFGLLFFVIFSVLPGRRRYSKSDYDMALPFLPFLNLFPLNSLTADAVQPNTLIAFQNQSQIHIYLQIIRPSFRYKNIPDVSLTRSPLFA